MKLSRREILSTGASAPLLAIAAGCTQEAEQSNSGHGGGAPPPSQAVAVEFAFYGLVLLRRHKVGTVGAPAASVLCMNSDFKPTIGGKEHDFEELVGHIPTLRIIDGNVTSKGFQVISTGLGQLVILPDVTLAIAGVQETQLTYNDGPNGPTIDWALLKHVPSLRGLAVNPELADVEPGRGRVMASVSISSGKISGVEPRASAGRDTLWVLDNGNGPAPAQRITDGFKWSATLKAGFALKLQDAAGNRWLEVAPKDGRPVRLELVHMPDYEHSDPERQEIEHAIAYHFALKDHAQPSDYRKPKRAEATGGGDPICMACQIDL